jgi:hypothetical protein
MPRASSCSRRLSDMAKRSTVTKKCPPASRTISAARSNSRAVTYSM